MCNRSDCANNIGKWVRFQTPWGSHRGIITAVNQNAVLVRVPRQYAPIGLANCTQPTEGDDAKKLDIALAQWGYGAGYGPGYGYGPGWGRPGYGVWYGGWWWWWLAFAWIFLLAFLW
ncbi:hypothetical protein ACOJUR_01805 [Alicyclobacillus tolerans]|uniref:Uncharacterized protein n=1 Tax=Alicyclobacillus tolerans TaxID=90970 RepID=A0A1M6PLG7_9BACL|nr:MULTISPECIES: hypothetical protein [Alicyclobacillus]QRF22316.1 hypothetical protein FY534_00445 [Alicyclobacillus sp. TC]SHK08745.1 hypothetical protein SAMN05443507_10867 [Alicyclobacillus montanus]